MIKKIEKTFIFHLTSSINPNKIKEFPEYYQYFFIKWEKHFLYLPSLPSSLASQCLWYNKYIKIDDKTIFSSSLSVKRMNFAGQLFQNNQQIKKWDELKTGFDLTENEKLPIIQVTHALPSLPKEILRNYTETFNNLVIQDDPFRKKTSNIFLE